MSAPSNALPHDIYGLSSYPETFFDHWGLILAILLLLCLLTVVFFLWRKRFKKKPIKKDPIDDFYELKTSLFGLKPEENFYEANYFFKLSFLLKQILEFQTEVPVTDLTFKEIEVALEEHGFSKNDRKSTEILAFLKRADMIKFAHMPTSFEEASKCHLMLCEWAKELSKKGSFDATIISK